jgi:hypothetical protein
LAPRPLPLSPAMERGVGGGGLGGLLFFFRRVVVRRGRWGGGRARPRQTINQRRLPSFVSGGRWRGATPSLSATNLPCPATDLSRWIILPSLVFAGSLSSSSSSDGRHKKRKKNARITIPRAARAFLCAAACPKLACETEPPFLLPFTGQGGRGASSGAPNRFPAGRIVLRRWPLSLRPWRRVNSPPPQTNPKQSLLATARVGRGLFTEPAPMTRAVRDVAEISPPCGKPCFIGSWPILFFRGGLLPVPSPAG